MSDSEGELLMLCYIRNRCAANRNRLKFNLLNKRRLKSNAKNNKNRLKSKVKNKKTKNQNVDNAKTKRIWLRQEIEESTRIHGQYTFVKQLSSEKEQIVRNLNMCAADFYDLLDLVRNDIEKQNTNFRNPIPIESRLSVALRYLSCSESRVDMAKELCIGNSTIHHIIVDACEAIYKRLQPIVMPQLSMEKLRETVAKMKESTHFPNCVGVLDGKCLFPRKYYQLKRCKGINNKCSTVLFGLADVTYCFLAVQVVKSTPSDIQQFLSSSLGNMIPDNIMPPASHLLQSGIDLPHVVLGNECLPLTKSIMTPYKLEELLQDPYKGVYNKIHCEALEVTAYAFGLMVQRYKFFQKPNLLNYETNEIVIKACCCLHNFIRLKELSRGNGQIDENALKEVLESARFESLEPYLGPVSATGETVRQNFLTHFSLSLVKQERSN